MIKLEEIGRGGFGTVFKVYDIKKNRNYALKMIVKNNNDKLENLLQDIYHEIYMA